MILRGLLIAGGLVLIANKLMANNYRSFLNKPGLPRGIRNNNPGNLVKTNIEWKGKIIPSGDTRFEQFINIAYGVRAMIKDIMSDIGPDTTLSDLIYQYAPPSDNNTIGYINYVSNKTGIGANQVLTKDKATLKKLVFAMSEMENGGSYLIDTDFNQAWSLL